jgi:hypothetical protein
MQGPRTKGTEWAVIQGIDSYTPGDGPCFDGGTCNTSLHKQRHPLKAKLTAAFAPKYSLAGSCGCRILATEMASADRDEVNEVAQRGKRSKMPQGRHGGQFMNESPGVPVPHYE